jgi:hypothetical protein
VGLYREGSDDTAYTGWCYLNGTKSAPTTAMVNASAPCFAAPAPGRYQVRLFSNNSLTKVAASNTITVPAPAAPAVTLTPDPATVGSTLTAAVANGPGNAADWVGLYREGSGDTAYIGWCYLNGAKSAPTTAMVNASAPCFTAPAPGRYEVRLFSNNSLTKVAASNTITVP